MDEDLVTCDKIIEWLQTQVKKKLPIPPNVFIDAAEKMNILLGDEEVKYADLFQKVAQLRVDMAAKDGKIAIARIKMEIEASDAYREMTLQKRKIDRVQEHIRLAKIQARMSNDEIKGY